MQLSWAPDWRLQVQHPDRYLGHDQAQLEACNYSAAVLLQAWNSSSQYNTEKSECSTLQYDQEKTSNTFLKDWY